METQAQDHTNAEDRHCPECGYEEAGHFCRNCGTLLHGDGLVLCPRCRQVVPDGDFCNQCGQGLTGLALGLRQLALAGDAFWVAEDTAMLPSSVEPSLLPPDASVELADAQLPDWLQEVPPGLGNQPAEALSDPGHPSDRVIATQRCLYGDLYPAGGGSLAGSTRWGSQWRLIESISLRPSRSET
jgi:hypothetical protein